jgi:hypothetical protein
MMVQSTSTRISELERRVGTLTNVAIIQAVVLVHLTGLLPIAAFVCVALLPILAFTHKSIPALAKRCGRLFSFASDVSSNPTPSADNVPTA